MQSLMRCSVGVRGKRRDHEAPRQFPQAGRDTRDQFPVKRKRAVEVQHHVLRDQGLTTGNR